MDTEAISAAGMIAAASGSVGGIAMRTAKKQQQQSKQRTRPPEGRGEVVCSVEAAGPAASIEGEPFRRCKAAFIGLRNQTSVSHVCSRAECRRFV